MCNISCPYAHALELSEETSNSYTTPIYNTTPAGILLSSVCSKRELRLNKSYLEYVAGDVKTNFRLLQ